MHSKQHHMQKHAHDITHETPPNKTTPSENPLNETNLNMINEELITDNEFMNLHNILCVPSNNNTTPLET